MNVENIDKLIVHLRDVVTDQQFDMSDWIDKRSDCGTVGCIAGHAAMIGLPRGKLESIEDFNDLANALDEHLKENEAHSSDGSFSGWGAWWLGIDADSADELFMPTSAFINNALGGDDDGPFRYEKVTRAMAIKMLERLKAQGSVGVSDWAELYKEFYPA
jgi:hypothetical protein